MQEWEVSDLQLIISYIPDSKIGNLERRAGESVSLSASDLWQVRMSCGKIGSISSLDQITGHLISHSIVSISKEA